MTGESLIKTKTKKRLNTRIIVRCIIMAAALAIGMGIFGYFQYRNSTFHTYNEFGYQIGDVAVGFVDGDTVADYLKTGIKDRKYVEMDNNIYNLYKRAKVGSIYVFIPDVKEKTLAVIYDVRVKEADDPAPYDLGFVDKIGGSPDEVIKTYQTGKRSEDYFIRKNQYGYNTSAVLPVFDSNKNVTALVAVDIPMLTIQDNLRHYIIVNVILTIIIGALSVVGLHLLINKSIVKPLKLISDEAVHFVKSEQKFSDKLNKINTQDEIEALADSILKMEKDINQYIDDITSITAEKERIGAELDVATKIQASMLPCIFPPYPERREFDIYATMTPAKEVGGDFYDFFLIDDDHFAMVMADVSGKGVPAALFMVISKTLIKNFAQFGQGGAAETLQVVNQRLCENNDADMFVTVWLGILEISTGKITAVNAGHEFPVLKRKDGDYELFKDKHGFVVAGMDMTRYKSYEIKLEPGDRIYLYTDGVPEATNGANELFGTGRMLEALNENKDAGLNEVLKNVKERIDEFVGDAPQFDDITMLCFEYNGSDNTRGERNERNST